MNDFEKDIVHITIYGAQSKITGDAPWQEVYEACSYRVEGAEFSKAFKRGLWNGKTYLINKKTSSFPSGLVNLVKDTCELEGKQVFIHDQRVDPGSMSLYGTGTFNLNTYKATGKYKFQLEAAEKAVEEKRGILKIATGGGKTGIFARIISRLQLPTLVVVPSKELLYQTRKVLLEQIIGATEKSIGLIGDSEWQVGELCTVAIIDTLASRQATKEFKQLVDNTDVLIADECHNTGASLEAFDVLSSFNSYYRYAFSGTPVDRSDGANLKVHALFSDIIVDVSYKYLVDNKVLPKAKIIFDKIQKPTLQGKLAYSTAYKTGVVENKYLNERIVEWTKICVDQGLSVLILVDQIQHGKTLDDMLWNVEDSFIPHTFINGQMDQKDNRESGFEAFDKREIPVLIASSILDTGVSTDAIDVLILAGSKKSKIRTLQRLGRALRGTKAIVIEFSNYCHKYLLEHSLIRLKDYKRENCFDIVSSGPNTELIRRLWDGGNK